MEGQNDTGAGQRVTMEGQGNTHFDRFLVAMRVGSLQSGREAY